MATKQILRQNSVNCDKSDLSAMWKKKFCTWQFFLHRHCLWCLWQIWGMIKFRQSEKYNYQMIKHWKNSRRLGGVSSIWLWDVSPPLLQALTMQPRLKEVGFGLLCCCVYILLRHWFLFFLSMQLKALTLHPRLDDVGFGLLPFTEALHVTCTVLLLSMQLKPTHTTQHY